MVDSDNYEIGINLIKDNFYSQIPNKICMLKNFDKKYLFYTKDKFIKKIKKIYNFLVEKYVNFNDKIPDFVKELKYINFEKDFINCFNKTNFLVCLNNDYYYKIEYYDNYPESTINLHFHPFNHQFSENELYNYEDNIVELEEDLDEQIIWSK